MSPKKSPDVTLHEVESEIAQLAGESPAAPQPSELQSFFKDFLARQDTQHVELLKSLTTSSQQSLQAILSAVQPATTRPQQTSSVAACPSQLDSAPAVVRGLYTPSSMSAIDAVGDWEEVEGDGDGDGHSSDEDQDFEGWSFTPSGNPPLLHLRRLLLLLLLRVLCLRLLLLLCLLCLLCWMMSCLMCMAYP
ncbi:unnamed protein product [Meganyctiphanes norvegica]|uniref:Uncharacterized protein n=1 Tax=Meganyctiphanes norvegica TaxID=48144 RepID=A0AAV2QLI5_MEGNR